VTLVPVSRASLRQGAAKRSGRGDSRAWLLVRLGSDWRNAVTSVGIDRGVGVGLVIAAGFVTPLLPSGCPRWIPGRGAGRSTACCCSPGALGLLFAPTACRSWAQRPMILSVGLPCPCIHHRGPFGRWDARRACRCPSRTQQSCSPSAWALVPISISGWGLRELAVISLLGHRGIGVREGRGFGHRLNDDLRLFDQVVVYAARQAGGSDHGGPNASQADRSFSAPRDDRHDATAA
jgi:hypothetical protein